MIERVKDGARRAVRGALDPVVSLLDRMGVRPDHVTWFGLVVTVTGGVFMALGHFRVGAAIATVGSLMDTLDGGLARKRNEVSRG